MRALLPFFVLAIFGGSISGQDINYFGLFPTIDHSAEINKKLSYNVYIFDAIKPYQSRENGIKDEARSFYFYTEAGLSYALTGRLSFTASYVYERQNAFNSYFRNENRLFQQLTFKLPLGKNELKQRLRFDERFIQDRFTGNTPFTHRLRYLTGIRRPLGKQFYGFAYSEFFFNTTPGAIHIFNENWSAVQLGFKLNQVHSLEAGPLYVGWINNTQGDWLNQFYLQLTWVSHLNFNK